VSSRIVDSMTAVAPIDLKTASTSNMPVSIAAV
jgi:hypothetical protein